MLAYILLVILLVPSAAHATIFFDDEMEQGTIGFNAADIASHIASGAYTYDTVTKFSGSGSLRLNYPPECEGVTFGGPGCGGGALRTFALTENLYRRAYFRMSGLGPNVTTSELFEVSINTFTKMMRTVSDGLNRDWWTMGCCRSKGFMIGLEHVPVNNATNVFTSKTLTDNQWYCLETHEQLNTPGVANGVVEAWVDGVKVLTRTGIMFRQADNSNRWNGVGIYRQTGRGNIWWDRYAAGDQRIGCIGSPPPQDTTEPSVGTNLVVQ